MLVLITYDVNTESSEGRKRLGRIAKICVNNGQRVQNSVFECVLNSAQFAELQSKLEKIADPAKDSLRYYMLGDNWQAKVRHYGAKSSYDPEDVLII